MKLFSAKTMKIKNKIILLAIFIARFSYIKFLKQLRIVE